MSHSKALAAAAQGKALPVYVCYGIDKYSMERFVAQLINSLVEPEHREFALGKYDLQETGLSEVIEDAETPPFMVPRKVIVARPALFFTGQKDTSKVEHPVDRLLQYIFRPTDFSTLIFIVEAEKLDERKKVVKALKDKGAVFPFLPLSAEDLTAWVRSESTRRGIDIAHEAVETLVLYTGGNLQALAGELDKLALYAGRSTQIDRETVEKLVVPTMEQNIFILIDEIVRLRLEKALHMFYELLKQKEEPVKIVILIARQFRIMAQVKELTRQGYSQQQIAGQVGVHPYAVKIAAEQAKSYTTAQLAEILSDLADLDHKMKSGKIDKVLGLELFLLGLAGAKARTSS
jgi:DNA polymerase III subunit delta